MTEQPLSDAALELLIKAAAIRDRYTKDLEDMLKRIVEAYAPNLGTIYGLIIEAKALLERTGYTEDF